jgi:hypothetical protein
LDEKGDPLRVRKGIKMMTMHENDRFRSKITGNVYQVKKIVNETIVLESLNRTNQVLTELNNIGLFYEKEPRKDEDQG